MALQNQGSQFAAQSLLSTELFILDLATVMSMQSMTQTGRLLWRKRTGAGVEAVALAGETLLVASLDNFVYGFSLNGKRLWKKQLVGRISAQPLTAADGALFTPLSSLAGVVLGLPDGRQINSLPTGEEITTSASPIAVGDAVLLTTEHGLLAFARPSETAKPMSLKRN